MDPQDKKKKPNLQDIANAFNYFDSPKEIQSYGKSDEEIQKQIEEDAKKRALSNLQRSK